MNNRHLVFLILLLLTFQASAQKLMVTRFQSTNQIIAGDDRVFDNNNVPCALVKLQGAEVDSVSGAFEYRRRGAETWVYLTKGRYRLTLYKRDYGSLAVNFRDHDPQFDGVESNRVYLLEVSAPIAGAQQANTANYMTLWVTPLNATVTIDGLTCNVDPGEGTVSEVLTYGMHTVQVLAPGHETVTRNFNFSEDTQPLHINLKSIAAEVVIRATTPGTLISVNNEEWGTDHCVVRLSPRTYIIKGSKPGCQPQELTLTITDTQPREVTIPALQELTGTANIHYKPTGSNIRIDGRLVGNSPRIIPNLAVGKHSVEISRDGYRTYKGTINIEQNKEIVLAGTLEQSKAGKANQQQTANVLPVQPVQQSTTSITTTSPAIQTFTANGVSFTMVRVEGGTFTMGATSEQGSDASESEEPTHKVTLSSYDIGEAEVTQALWQAVMGSNPSHFKGSNLPVEQVTWEDCQDFIRELNTITGKKFRLPTEAEWEFAARGGNKSKSSKYSGSNSVDRVAWYEGNSSRKTHDVKTKAPNELGIYDMSGNVWEWCQDWYGDYSTSAQTNPTGTSSSSHRVCRGGSWYRSAGFCRVSRRDNNSPGNWYNFLGLRLAL